MAVKEVKDMGASVLARLKKQAKETKINYQTCQAEKRRGRSIHFYGII
ncbi:MAG: hypothetical protein II994_02855 [Lachnospiraceae bacterium]|nr:hypothetical protein [Lachnospiraceae bacterium]